MSIDTEIILNVNNWHSKALDLLQTGISWRKIAKELGIPKSTCSDWLRKQVREVKQQERVVHKPFKKETSDKGVAHDNSCILFISDIHAPYEHKNTIGFLEGLRDKYKPTRVILLGDELDKHSLSYHDSDPNLMSAGDELEAGKKVIAELHKLFPVADIMESNHGSMVFRKAKTHGIPKQYIKSYREVLGVGEGWKWHYDLTTILPDGSDLYVHHGRSSDALTLSQKMGMSVVQGHYHTKFKIDYWANPRALMFALQCGCLIDDDSLAYAYNNVNIERPIIGTGLIVDSKPVLEPMKL